jgi:LmbE family N-acetylglucosaminyl deacetylase
MDFAGFVRQQSALWYATLGQDAGAPVPLRASGLDPVGNLLIVAPHPDDECLMAGLALRAMEEWGTRVTVLPFSYGSKVDRRQERQNELKRALASLGFELFDPRQDPLLEELSPDQLAKALTTCLPDAVLFPHDGDGHPAHIRCSRQVSEGVTRWALASQRRVHLFETAYWQDLAAPNLMVELTSDHVIRMGSALLEHRGEIERNPYHLSLPAHLIDSRRKGVERVSGMGSRSGTGLFAQLLRHSVMN